MSRRISMFKRATKKDLKYDNFIVSLLINKVLKNGKKRLAQRIVYKCFNLIENRIKKKPVYILEKVIKNIGPRVKAILKSNGKKLNPTPTLLNKYGASQIAVRWIVNLSRKHTGKPMFIKLSNELLDAYKGIGSLMKKKEAMHKYAEANKSYAKHDNDDIYEN